MKLLLLIMISFLCWLPTKEYFPSGKLKSITWSTNWVRAIWWSVIGMLIWRLNS